MVRVPERAHRVWTNIGASRVPASGHALKIYLTVLDYLNTCIIRDIIWPLVRAT